MNEEQLASITAHISRLAQDLDALQAVLHAARDASWAACRTAQMSGNVPI